jgi:hypothetical protein
MSSCGPPSQICAISTAKHAGARMIKITAARVQRRSFVIPVIATTTAALVAIGLAAPRSGAAGPEGAPSPPAAQYLPSISDMMIATIQPRHERLWRAEQNGNWEFATYELGNLKGAFTRLGHAHPVHGDISLPDMITSVTEQPFKALESAVKSRDATAFTKAYADLTDACNSCHQALNHGVVEIRVPDRTSASDLIAEKPRN